MSHSLAVPGVLGTMGFRMPDYSLSRLLRMAADEGRVLVMIFLEGGNDGLNTVIPLDQLSALNSVRPHVILPENKIQILNGTSTGLHPALSGLKSLYDEKRLQVVQGVGYPEQSYSHFRSTDIWMSASDSDELVNTGWSGRYLGELYPEYPESFPNDEMTDPLAVEIGYGSSLLFQGPQASMSTVISNPEFFYNLVENHEEDAPDTPAGDKLRYIRLIARQSQAYGDVLKNAAAKVTSQVTFPDTSLGKQLKIVSQLIAGGLKTPLYMVRLGGFDTHDAQVEEDDHTIGEHADLLTELDQAIMAFMKDLEKHGTDDKVLGMTFSEFGRRIVSNASLGTDHGAAAPLFFFGNAVTGGVTGANPEISAQSTYEDNLPLQHDFRQVYSSVLQQWFGASADITSRVVGGNFENFQLIGKAAPLGSQKQISGDLMVYPNPMRDMITVRMSPTSEPVAVDLMDLMGRKVARLYEGNVNSNQEFYWNASGLPAGKYLVIMKGASTKRVFHVVKV